MGTNVPSLAHSILGLSTRTGLIFLLLQCCPSATAQSGDIRATRVDYASGASPVSVAWNPPFQDTNYTAVCTAETSFPDFLLPIIQLRSADSIQVSPTSGGAFPGVLYCLAIADSDVSDIRHARTPGTGGPSAPPLQIFWNSPFPDTNYTAVCTAEGNVIEYSGGIVSVLPDSITMVQNLANVILNCMAVPDSTQRSDIRTSRPSVPSGVNTVTVPWNAPFPNTNYAPVCTRQGGGIDGAIAIVPGSEQLGSMEVFPEGAAVAHCIAAALHCQVSVQKLGQCRLFDGTNILPGWPSGTNASDQYAFHAPYNRSTLDGSICVWGCALTSLSMALNQAGIPQIPDCRFGVCTGGPTVSNDPGSLNWFLKARLLYTFGNDVNFDVATRGVASALNLPTPKVWRFDFSHEGELGAFASSDSPCLGVACQTLDNYLCADGKPVIVRVVGADGIFGDHKVLVVGKQANDYRINDPANDSTLPRHTLLSQYIICEFGACTAVFSIVGVVKDPSGDIGGLDLATDTNAELLVFDSSGRRTGFDAVSSQDVKEIPNSTHYVEATDDEQTGAAPTEFSHIVNIFQPVTGNYQIIVEGLRLGTYAVEVRAFSQDGSVQPALSISGIADIGSTSSFQIQFSTTSGSSSTVARVATFQTTLADINNSLQLGLIDNPGIANALSRKIRAAASAVAEHESDDAREILRAFKRQVSAQGGKHITGVAPQVLQEDADSLISQL